MSYTTSRTGTVTEAKVRKILDKVGEDMMSLRVRGMITESTWESWRNDLAYLLQRDGLELYEFQVITPGGRVRGIRYTVLVGGVLHTSDVSGGLQLYDLPRDSRVTLVIRYRDGKDHLRQEMRRRGWTSGARLVQGAETQDRLFSVDNYGHRRSIREENR